MHQLTTPCYCLFFPQAVLCNWVVVRSEHLKIKPSAHWRWLSSDSFLVSPRITTYYVVVDTAVVLLCMQFARF